MKLFRKVRQELISDGKLKKYIPYAIGEIFLVMIGISLAFQLNNWNDNRIKKKSEIMYYENIRSQISDDRTLIEEQKSLNNEFIHRFNYANKIIESNDKTKIDTLAVIIISLTQYTDFDRQGNIYETLVNSGEIKLLRSQNIVNGIRELEEKYIYINRMENIHYDAIMKHVVAAINPVIKFSDASIQKLDRVYNYEFQNLFISLIQVMKEKDKVYYEAINKIEEIINSIDRELC